MLPHQFGAGFGLGDLLFKFLGLLSRQFPVANDLRHFVRRNDVPDQNGVDGHTEFIASLLQMFFQIVLELLPGFADNKFHGGLFAALDADKTAGAGQNQFLDNVFHIADFMGQHRRHFPARVELDGAFNPDGKAVRGKKLDRFGGSPHLKTLALEVYFDHRPQIRIEIVCAGVHDFRINAFAAGADQIGVAV